MNAPLRKPDSDFSAFFSRIGAALKLKLETSVEGALPFDPAWTAPLETALVQAVRGCLARGGAPGAPVVKLSASREGDQIVILCEDTGTAIEPWRVREAMRERNPRFEAEMGAMSDEDVLQFLFVLPGIGVRLDAVREAVELELGGRARVESRRGAGMRLVLKFPADAQVGKTKKAA